MGIYEMVSHVWSEDRQMRYMAADEVERRDVLFALSNILRARIQDIDNRKKEQFQNHII